MYYGDYRTGTTSNEANIITRAGLGGQGGGALKIDTRHFILDGQVTADGEHGPSLSTAGGGSGGSIWVHCQDLSGYGKMSVNGGDGSPGTGGGGSGGRLAVYHTSMINFNGTLSAKGGNSAIEPGASGTVYLERWNVSSMVRYKVLKVNNFGMAFPWAVDKSDGRLKHLLKGIYHDIRYTIILTHSSSSMFISKKIILCEFLHVIRYIGGVTWLHESTNYTLDEFHLHGNSHLVIYGNGSQKNVTFRSGVLVGDKSGIFHVGRYQYVAFDFVNLYYPINTLVYYGGYLQVPPRLSLRFVNTSFTMSFGLKY